MMDYQRIIILIKAHSRLPKYVKNLRDSNTIITWSWITTLNISLSSKYSIMVNSIKPNVVFGSTKVCSRADHQLWMFSFAEMRDNLISCNIQYILLWCIIYTICRVDHHGGCFHFHMIGGSLRWSEPCCIRLTPCQSATRQHNTTLNGHWPQMNNHVEICKWF